MTNEPICPECSSEHVVFSKKRKLHVCEDCGHTFPAEKPSVPLRIFLSYGHDSNEELVRRIKADLEQRGHDVWFDKTEIKAGDDWRRSITDGIAQSHQIVSFLSKHSTRDPGVCRDEIAIAIGVKGGNIQTILVESEQQVQPPQSISHIQWLDMHDWKEARGVVRTQKDKDGNPYAVGDAAWEQWYLAKFDEIVRVVESDESRRFAGEIETLNGHLKPIKSEARICQLLSKGFYGRQWLFEAVERWRQDTKLERPSGSESRLFWIMGAPGVGKSAFAAQLTHTRGDTVIAAQFCDWTMADHRDARRVVRSLAFQLATRLPDYRKLLLTLPEIADLDRKDAAELFDYLLANPLRSVIHGGRQRYLIVIDALDEAGEAGRNPLVEMLARNAKRLPDWLGLVVTSRPEFDVKTPLQALNPFPLDTKSESNRVDIRDYLRRELATQLHGRADADRLVEQILEKSEGVFLYVERFCDDAQRGDLSLEHPEQFPQGLGGIFCQYFQRQFPDLDKFRKDVRPALRAILAAREPLPVEILQRLFGWQDENLRDFNYPLASLFPVTMEAGEVIKPYHKSLADWLGDQEKAGPYFVSPREGHRILADMCAAVVTGQPLTGALADYAILHVAEHCFAVGLPTKEFSLLLRVVTPDYIIGLARQGNSPQALADNACCLEALAKQERAANPVRRLAHALLACLLQDIADEGYRTGAYILDRAERGDFAATSSLVTARAAILLLLAEGALDRGEKVTAQKLVDEACDLSLSCWEGIDLGPLQAVGGKNLPHDSPLINNLRHHALVGYLARLAAQLPEAAFQIANRVSPKRDELPNLATLWLAVLDAVPAEADVSGMERFFTFTDRHIADLCETVADYREIMDRFLLAVFRHKDRLSSEFVVDSVLKCTQIIMTHLRKSFGEEWAFVRLLSCLTHLVTPPAADPNLADVYRQTAMKALELLEAVLFQEGKEVPIQVGTYYLRLRFECGLSIDQHLLRYFALYAFGGLLEERAHPLRFVEPIRVLYPISPEVVEEVAREANFKLVPERAEQAPVADVNEASDSRTTRHIVFTTTSNPNAPGLAVATATGPSGTRENMTAAMHRSRGMLDFHTILLVDPFASESESERSESATKMAGPFEWNRHILALLRQGTLPAQIEQNINNRLSGSQWREKWRATLTYFLWEMIYRLAVNHGEDARPLLRHAGELGLPEALFRGLIAMGEARASRPLSHEQFASLRQTAQDFLARNESYGLTMLAWASLQRLDTVLEIVDHLEAREEQWLFWLILFRDCTIVPDSLAEAGVKRLRDLSHGVASEEDFQRGMECLLILKVTPGWEEIRRGLDTAYEGFSRKSCVSQELCHTLLRAARHTPEVCKHSKYEEVLQDHMGRITAHWFDGSSPDEMNRKRLSEALRELTANFVRHAIEFKQALIPAFREIVLAHDIGANWHAERALLFPNDFAINVQRLASEIEKTRNWSADFPEYLRGPAVLMVDSVARSVSPDKDPIGTLVASPFANLTLLARRSGDPSVTALVEQLLSDLPVSAVPTIAVAVIHSALARSDLETVKEWLPRASGLLRSEVDDWNERLPETAEGLEVVMRMLNIDPAFETINNTIPLFVSACLEHDTDTAQVVAEGRTLLGLVPESATS